MPNLEESIAARPHEALDHHDRAEISAPAAQRGLAVGGPDTPVIVLTVEDNAHLAAQVIVMLSEQTPRSCATT
jgi:hypothetical protein